MAKEEIPSIKSIDDVLVERVERIKVRDYIGPEYKRILDKVLIDGKLAYAAETKDGKFVVNIDGKESDKYEKVGKLPYEGRLVELCGQLTYVVKTGDGKQHVISGDSISKSYQQIHDIFEFNGKLGYSVRVDDNNNAVVLDGKEGQRYWGSILNPYWNLDGKLTYSAKKHNKTIVYNFGGVEIPAVDMSIQDLAKEKKVNSTTHIKHFEVRI